VSGGQQNTANGQNATVSGGDQNMATNEGATVSCGEVNTAGGEDSTVSGGDNNHASAFLAMVDGGRFNTASGVVATVSGGFNNTATNEGTPTTSFQVGLATCNGLTWNNSSDRNSKEDFTAINPRAVLEKVSSMPITEWKYKVETHGIQHIGPMAQDFHAAFDLDGADDKHISTVDEGGVALAAIQGLNQKLQSELNRQDSENAKLKQQNELLFERLNELEMAVKSISEKK
jgi:trimeric autotransporter adhesin